MFTGAAAIDQRYPDFWYIGDQFLYCRRPDSKKPAPRKGRLFLEVNERRSTATCVMTGGLGCE